VAVVLLVSACRPGGELPGGAQQLPSISVDRVFQDGSHAAAIARITNEIQPAGYGLVGVRCTFFRGGKAADDAGNVATNVPYRQPVFVKVLGPGDGRPVDSATCRVTYANR
jgi:hypothetical protein